ncbi:aminopeptidase [Niameybacter massiliensis]|uniref:Aminopeptidase n=1 Tax=Holtiella tumoricola TaxID=3018743 RepID=A0AA42DLK1_9FIRM|nr:aminopeptidase [Holtiella tumoricola]MDA3730888.1 aminopeptidase [Holtiella tumoricola]
MRDPRITKLAQNLIQYSVQLQAGEKLLIDLPNGGEEIATALVEEAYRVGGIPFVNLESEVIRKALLLGATKEQYEYQLKYDLERMKDMDAYIGVRKVDNLYQMSDVPSDKMKIYTEYSGPLHAKERCQNTKWCILGYPTNSFAQTAHMSTQAFEDYYFNVCALDYAKFHELMKPLHDLMDKTDKVHIIAPGTDLTFSIKDCWTSICSGRWNIPDGEVGMAGVVTDSVNGTIAYNVPSNYQGTIFTDVKFKFKDGKIVEATANETEKLNAILDTDEGARYICEFSLGTNPFMEQPIYNTLFDEKMIGTMHFTPGHNSAIHWDLIQSHKPQDGGGEIWFDGVLIRKDGEFVVKELLHLNKEALKKALSME